MRYEGQPRSCIECHYSKIFSAPEPMCCLTHKEFTHNPAKCRADWCPIKDGKTVDDFRNLTSPEKKLASTSNKELK